MLAGRALAAFAQCRFKRDSVDLDATPDRDVVDGNARVLAQQIVGRLRHGDVANHRAQHVSRGRDGFARRQRGETLLDVVGQDLERADVELTRSLFDSLRIDVHRNHRSPKV